MKKRTSKGGGGKRRQSKSGTRFKPDSFGDVTRALRKYCRENDLVKSMHEHKDEMFARKGGKSE